MQQEIDKSLVAQRFGKQAANYDAVTPVQNAMAHYLGEKARAYCPPDRVHRILELGCGTGRLTRILRDSYGSADITSIDISPSMVEVARKTNPDVRFETVDAEDYIRGRREKYDLIVSNAAVQWFQQPEMSLPLCRELLSDHGVLALSTFGNETFRELKASFIHAYAKLGRTFQGHVGELPDAKFWRKLFPESQVVEQFFYKEFPDVRSFLRSIQTAGATNSFEKQAYIHRQVLREMLDFYSSSFPVANSGGIICTYQAIFLFCRGGNK